MPMPVVNYVAVIFAALSGFALGVAWYSRFLFGRRWMRAGAPDDFETETFIRPSTGMTLMTVLFNLISAYLLASFFLPDEPVMTTTLIGAAIGLGCVACSLAVNYPLTRQPAGRLFIDGGFHVVRFALMGLILGIWH